MVKLEEKLFKRNIHIYKSPYGDFSLKKFHEKSGYKVNIQLLNDEELIAYLAFKVGGNFTRADFSGMFVKPLFRNNGISKEMFQIYQEVANFNKLSTDITKNQKKPLVCKVLKGFGYEAKGKSNDQKVEIIDNKLFFEHPTIRNKYLNSNFNKQPELDTFLLSEKEKILGIIEPKNVETIYLNTKYKKT